MAESGFDLSAIAAGLLAYALSVGVGIALVFLTYRLNTLLTSRIEEERLLDGFVLCEVAGPAKSHPGREPLAGHFRYVTIPEATKGIAAGG